MGGVSLSTRRDASLAYRHLLKLNLFDFVISSSCTKWILVCTKPFFSSQMAEFTSGVLNSLPYLCHACLKACAAYPLRVSFRMMVDLASNWATPMSTIRHPLISRYTLHLAGSRVQRNLFLRIFGVYGLQMCSAMSKIVLVVLVLIAIGECI